VALRPDFKNFWNMPNLLLQKFPAPFFTVTTKTTFEPRNDDERAGVIVMGTDYAYISVKKRPDGLYVSQTICKDADQQSVEKESAGTKLIGSTFYLRVRVEENAVCNFAYSTDGRTFIPIGESFKARQGRWIGAKVGIFAVGNGSVSEMGYADFDWFRVE
jgi:beta-xylosidase